MEHSEFYNGNSYSKDTGPQKLGEETKHLENIGQRTSTAYWRDSIYHATSPLLHCIGDRVRDRKKTCS